MPIRPFLNGGQIDQETLRILGVAFEHIADKIIALAKADEWNPDVLCERVLKDIRGPDM